MWIEDLPNGKYKFVERYCDPYTDKIKKISVTLTSKSARAKNEANRMLTERIAKLLNADRNAIDKRTFEEVTKEWLEDYRTDYKRPRKGSTYSARSYQVDTLLEKYLLKQKNYLIHAMDAAALQGAFNAMLDAGLSYNYIKALRALVGGIFKYAKVKGYLSNIDAYESTYVPQKLMTVIEMADTAIPAYLEDDDLKRVLAAMKPDHARLFEVQAYTGMRISEALALEEIDLDGNTLYIRGTFDSSGRSATKGEKTPPKTRASYRNIIISDRIKALIMEQISVNKLIKRKNNAYIFVNSRGNPYDVSALNRELKAVKDKLQLQTKLSTHIFRHTHISMLAENNVPLHLIMQRVGHSDQKVTEKIYVHVTRKMKMDLADILENI